MLGFKTYKQIRNRLESMSVSEAQINDYLNKVEPHIITNDDYKDIVQNNDQTKNHNKKRKKFTTWESLISDSNEDDSIKHKTAVDEKKIIHITEEKRQGH